MKNKNKNYKSIEFKKEISIFARYIFLLFSTLIFLSTFFLNIMMSTFSYLSYLFLNLFTTATLSNNILTLPNNVLFLVVKECIAPNAYMLITLLYFSLPINSKVLVKIWLKSIILFSIFNLIRILLLMFIHVKFGIYWFDKLHLIFYEGLSGVVTALIIIYYLRKEKIVGVYPIYSDVKYLIEILKGKKEKMKLEK